MGKQFVVQLRNEPGAMATLAETLAARGVDLRAIGGGGIGDAGHVIMTTADDDTTRAVSRRGATPHRGRSILAEVDDRPGGMADSSRALADAGINIYGHCSSVAGATGRCRVRGRRSDRARPHPRAQGRAVRARASGWLGRRERRRARHRSR